AESGQVTTRIALLRPGRRQLGLDPSTVPTPVFRSRAMARTPFMAASAALMASNFSALLSIEGRPSAMRYALRLGPGKPGEDALANDSALEPGEHSHHLVHSAPRRGRRIEALLVQVQIDALRMQVA